MTFRGFRFPPVSCTIIYIARDHLFFLSNSFFFTEDFKSIPSAQLTLEQFHNNDAEIEYDPPSYIRSVVEHLHTQQVRQLASSTASGSSVYDDQSMDVEPLRVHLALPIDTSEEPLLSKNDHLLHDSSAKLHGLKSSLHGGDASVNVLVAAANIELGRTRAAKQSLIAGGKTGKHTGSAKQSKVTNKRKTRGKAGNNTTSGESTSESDAHSSSGAHFSLLFLFCTSFYVSLIRGSAQQLILLFKFLFIDTPSLLCRGRRWAQRCAGQCGQPRSRRSL